jgi:hypothetical protein
MAPRGGSWLGVSVGSVDVFGSTPPAPPHDGFRTAVARIRRVPLTGPSVAVVVATPCEFVIVGVGLIVSDAEGLVTKDQSTDCPETGFPLASTKVAVSVKGAWQVMVPCAATVTAARRRRREVHPVVCRAGDDRDAAGGVARVGERTRLPSGERSLGTPGHATRE